MNIRSTGMAPANPEALDRQTAARTNQDTTRIIVALLTIAILTAVSLLCTLQTTSVPTILP